MKERLKGLWARTVEAVRPAPILTLGLAALPITPLARQKGVIRKRRQLLGRASLWRSPFSFALYHRRRNY